ncbi:outer membrane protein transport protein, partial [Methylobacterium phyllosphaerae]
FLKGESWGVGFTAGATLTPRDGTVLGIGYRSSVHHDIDGSIGVPLLALAPLAGQVRARLNTPDKLSVGL